MNVTKFVVFVAAVSLFCGSSCLFGQSVTVLATSGTRGANWTTGTDPSTGLSYIIPTGAAQASGYPDLAANVVTYTVTFPKAGTYDLYLLVQFPPSYNSNGTVVANGCQDDDGNYAPTKYPGKTGVNLCNRMYIASSFGTKSVTTASNWVMVDEMYMRGYANNDATDIVDSLGTQTSGVWKWINISRMLYGPTTYTVASGALTQTFQIGAAEPGGWYHSFVFAPSYYGFTANDLNLGDSGTAPPASTTVQPNWLDVHQQIDGFGASSYTLSGVSAANITKIYGTAGTSAGDAGHTLLRGRIGPVSSSSTAMTVESGEQVIWTNAYAAGAKIWIAPWTPPNSLKSNGATAGGSFVGNATNYQTYANAIAAFVQSEYNTYGIPIYAVSVQNEPDISNTYETCLWTAQQIHDYIPYLYSALQTVNLGSNPKPMVLMPDAAMWGTPLAGTALQDPAVASMIGVQSYHGYGGNSFPVPSYNVPHLWESETSDLIGSASDINNGIYWANQMYQYLTVAQVNGWHYWWLIGSGGQYIAFSTGTEPVRFYTFAQYSRFVRPGYYRIGSTTSSWLINASAYMYPANGSFAIVAINWTGVAQPVTFNLSSFPNVGSVTPWVTDASLSLASQSSVNVANGLFTYTMPATSVVTFVGQATPADLYKAGAVTVARSGFVYNFTTKRYSQSVSMTNVTPNAIPGPVGYVLDNLSPNATVYDATGVTAAQLPAGSPYINLNQTLGAGSTVTFTVQFTDPTMTGITYTPRVLSGSVSR